MNDTRMLLLITVMLVFILGDIIASAFELHNIQSSINELNNKIDTLREEIQEKSS